MRAPLRLGLSTLGIAALLLGPAHPERASAGRTDTTPPVLGAISVPSGPHIPGSQVTWTLDIVDESDIERIQIEYVTPGTAPGYFLVDVHPDPGWATGTLTWTVPGTPTAAPHDGTYQTTAVFITDTAGNYARYYTDGALVTEPYAGSSEHSLDVRAPLSITQSPRDVTPPVLTSFRAPSSVWWGQSIGFEYAVADASSPHIIEVHGRQDGAPESRLIWRGQAPAQGVLTYPPSSVGLIDLTRVIVVDGAGNRATFFSDGTFTTGSESGGTSGTHSLVLSRIRVTPTQAEAVAAVPFSGGATLFWDQAPTAGFRVTVKPGNRVLSGGPSAVRRRSLRIPGLQNGVEYTIGVTATSTAGDAPEAVATVTPRMTLHVFGTGDHNGDRRADLWATSFGEATSDERWRLYTGNGAGGFGRTLHPASPYGIYAGFPGSTTARGPGAPWGALFNLGSDLFSPSTPDGSVVIGKGFGMFRTIDASSDFTSDGIADLIGITPSGDFYLYPSASTGAIGRGVRLGGGWSTFHAVFSPGDFNGDRRSDVVAVDSLGRLWLYPGTGRGGFGSRIQIGTGWGSFGSVLPLRDFNGDGKVDLGAITMDGRLFMYPGNGRGRFLAKSQIGVGWHVFL